MILLDTCILIRMNDGAHVPASLMHALQKEPCAASTLSAWEIGIKYQKGNLPLDAEPQIWWPRLMTHGRLQEFDFTTEAALLAYRLPPIHGDPFDRGIIATAIVSGMKLATVDGVFKRYAELTDLRLA